MMFTARDRLKLLIGASALTLSACGGGGSPAEPASAAAPPSVPPPPPPPASNAPTPGLLRDTFSSNFQVGAAVANTRIASTNPSGTLAIEQFDMITPEYELKLDQLAPTAGPSNFDTADRLVDWALNNNMTVRGHALLWHEATPDYFLQGTPANIRQRLEDYIGEVMTHFQGRITIWDVVNEAISTDIYRGADGVGPYRPSNWFNAVGSAEYIDWAFQAARAADPNAQLFLSDYETENSIKRGWLIDILNDLQSRNIPVDGVGHQFHLLISTPATDALAAIDAVDNQFMGLVNHVTELDINVYEDPGSCWESGTNCQADYGPNAPDSIIETQAQLYRDLFNGFVQRSSVEVVNLWGVKDDDSWLNVTPVTRSNHPLLFDRDGGAKPAYLAITDPNYVIGS